MADYSRFLHEHTHLRQLESHVEVTTPYLDRHNDYMQIYVRADDGRYELTDDGYIIDDLRASGCEINTPKRRAQLANVLNGFGVKLSGSSLYVHANARDFALRKHNLVQAMLAVGDLFYLSQPSIASFFLEDVAEWMRQSRVRFIASTKFTGKSGFDHLFDFVVPASEGAPERLVQAMNNPSRNTAESVAFAWIDVRDSRPSPASAIAIINDNARDAVPSRQISTVADALISYDVRPALWSRRDELLPLLLA